jgi:iron complex outermembrane receptor protein
MNDRSPFFARRFVPPTFAAILVGCALTPYVTYAQDLAVPEITVMGESTKTSPLDYAPTVSELSGKRLQRRQQSTVGETLSRETGVNSSQFGPNASRPVIRGLDGERIRILQNGTGVLDASAASQDHAIALDPLAVERFEIVRGPAALLYGSSAVGGVVNMITRRIPETMPGAFEGKLDSRYSTVDQGRSGGLVAEAGVLGNWAFHFDGGARGAENYKIPGFARTEALRSDPASVVTTEDNGEVTNSFNRTWNGALGGSYIFSNGFVGASYARYGSLYGTVAEKGVSIDMNSQRVDVAGALRGLGWVESAKLKTTISDYRHQEIANGTVGTTFKNRGNESRLEFKHQRTGVFDGLFGLQSNTFKFEALGDEAFLPSTDNQTYSAFVFEEATFGSFKPSLGLRGDLAKVDASAWDKGGAQTRDFTGGSASLGLIYELTQTNSVVLNSSYTERAPNYQEIFANGPHIATRQFEIGDPNIGKERSKAVELSLRHKEETSQGSVGLFVQDFNGFIALTPAGTVDPGTQLNLYNYRSVDAILYGAEAEVRHQFENLIPGGVVELEVKADFVRSRNHATGASLPRIPPLRETVGVSYRTDRYTVDVEAQRSERQTQLAANETETPAYTFLNAGVEAPITIDQATLSLFARATNLLDAEARNHVSILKDIAPLPGRNFTIGLQARF